MLRRFLYCSGFLLNECITTSRLFSGIMTIRTQCSASLPAAEGVTMEATVTLECSLAHEMMVMENVPVNLVEIVLTLGGFAEMMALERHAEMPVLVFDHPTLGQCSTYPIECSHE